LLSLFDQVFPEYQDEPLVKLFENDYFRRGDSSKFMDFSQLKIQLFLILSSQAELEGKVACLMELLHNEDKKIQRKTAEDVFKTLFEMCSTSLVDALS
jgi:hypothetical protein